MAVWLLMNDGNCVANTKEDVQDIEHILFRVMSCM